MPPDVSVVIVNFNSGGYLAGCIESLAPANQAGLACEIVVVDNASTHDQSAHLAEAEARGARVLRLERNTGYAGGCNRGTAATKGRFLFLLNADVVACRGALTALVQVLDQHEELGLVEPRCYVDAGRVWQQPEFFPLTPVDLWPAAMARVSGRFAERQSSLELRRQLPGWRTSGIHERRALSGAFLSTRREVLERVGGLDEGYPLAFEDSDLFRRVRAAGWKLALVPGAEAIHFAHRSRITVLDESVAKDRIGRHRYLRAHHGRSALWLDRSAEWLQALALRLHRPAPRERFVQLGSSREPLELELAGAPGPYVMQLALEPFFALTVGQIGSGASYRFSEPTWRSLLPIPLYVRAFALEDLAPRGAWALRREDGGA